jgi:hypothetical protein
VHCHTARPSPDGGGAQIKEELGTLGTDLVIPDAMALQVRAPALTENHLARGCSCPEILTMETLQPIEEPERVLSVEDSEISAPKWISPEQQAILDRQAEEEAAREAAKKDSPFERALREMMGGSLNANEDQMRLDAVVPKDAWMVSAASAALICVWATVTEIRLCHTCSCQEILRVQTARQEETPVEEMSDAEKEALAEFEAAAEARAEFVEKSVNVLKTEMRKNVADIAEVRAACVCVCVSVRACVCVRERERSSTLRNPPQRRF